MEFRHDESQVVHQYRGTRASSEALLRIEAFIGHSPEERLDASDASSNRSADPSARQSCECQATMRVQRGRPSGSVPPGGTVTLG